VVKTTLRDVNGISNNVQRRRAFLAGELNKTSDQPHAITGRAYYLWADWKLDDKHVFLLEDYTQFLQSE